jgi:hypothetical protein
MLVPTTIVVRGHTMPRFPPASRRGAEGCAGSGVDEDGSLSHDAVSNPAKAATTSAWIGFM